MAFRIVVDGEVAWVTGTASSRSIEMEYERFRAYLLNMTFAEPTKETRRPPRLQSTNWAGIHKRWSRYLWVPATFSTLRGITT